MANESNALTAFSDSLVKIVEKAGEMTVLVNGRRRMPASGIVYAPDLILTADHVVERDEDIKVTLADGTTINATVAGRDPGNDVALLRLEQGNFIPAEKAYHDAKVGQVVVALGRPSLEGIEASFGIVSAIGGPVHTGHGGMLERYLRTDAIPFPGFSGGPLIDTDGESGRVEYIWIGSWCCHHHPGFNSLVSGRKPGKIRLYQAWLPGDTFTAGRIIT